MAEFRNAARQSQFTIRSSQSLEAGMLFSELTIRRSIVIFVAALPLSACAALDTEPVRRNAVPARQQGAAPPSAAGGVAIDLRKGFLGFAEAAESVVVGRLVRAETQAPGPDGFYTSAEFAVEEVLRGPPTATGTTITVRFPTGQNAAGQWHTATTSLFTPYASTSLRVGDRALLLLSRQLYEEQVRAKGGTPLSRVIGAGLGSFRITGQRVDRNHSATEIPATLTDLRRLLRGQ